MSKINQLNEQLSGYINNVENIKSKIKDIAIAKNIYVQPGIDTPLTVLNDIDSNTIPNPTDATATSTDILYGKVAYGNNGTRLEGTITTYEGPVEITENGTLYTSGTYLDSDIDINVSSGGLNINGEIIQASIAEDEYISQGDFVALISESPNIVKQFDSLTDIGLRYGVALQSGLYPSTINVCIPYTSYSVDYNLGNCTSSNSSTNIRRGESYSTTITPDIGYDFTDAAVTVRMNLIDITSTAYDNGNIYIDNITGDLIITVVCGYYESLTDVNDNVLVDANGSELIFVSEYSPTTYHITTQLSGCYLENIQTEIIEYESYQSNVYALPGYSLNGSTNVLIYMNGENITYSVYSNGYIDIQSVTADITITISAANEYNIIPDIEGGALSGSLTISEGEIKDITLVAYNGYMIPDNIQVSGASYSYNAETGNISLANATQDVTIQASCIAAYSVQTDLIGCFLSPNISHVEEDNPYITTVYQIDNYDLEHPTNLSITMGGVDITSSVYTFDAIGRTGSIDIQNVTGDISITIYAQSV